jgi:NADPH:quinone reductase-like Zn-dependent oxidoreductase
VVPADRVITTPETLTDEQAAAAWLVYLTAWGGLVEWSSVNEGEWVLVTAANSAVGLAALDVARYVGARTIGVVRSEQAAAAIADAGFEYVVRGDGERRWSDRIRTLTDGGAHVALDAVLGDTGNECLRALRPYGNLIVYGALSGEPLTVRGGLAIGRQPTIRGMWIGQWLQDGPADRIGLAFERLNELFADGSLKPRVERTFPLPEVAAAVRYMSEPGRVGKVVLTC